MQEHALLTLNHLAPYLAVTSFSLFSQLRYQRQMVAEEKPRLLSRVPLPMMGRMMGWNLIIKARKPAR